MIMSNANFLLFGFLALASFEITRLKASATSPALQLLKKGTTGLIVGNARGNLCLISGDKRLTNAGTRKKNLMVVLAVYGPPIVGAQSHLAVEKVP